MTDSIFDSTSFSSLDGAGKFAVRYVFDLYDAGQSPEWDYEDIFRRRKTLATLHGVYSKKMAQTNPAIFKYLDKAQRSILKDELLFTFYLLSAQYQLDEMEHRRQELKPQSEQIKACAKLLYQLRLVEEQGFEANLHEALDSSEKHLKYLGLTTVAPFLTEEMTDFSKGKTVVSKQKMTDVNVRRLYWVWAGGMLSSVLALLPDDFYNRDQAQQVVSSPSTITGYMSWVLYYTRFGINLGLLLKHTIKGPWMSKEEYHLDVSTRERFKTQWDMRKFSLLNDSIWATCNLACFYWLVGNGMAGYYGNVLTALLLLMDACLTAWKFCEENTEHNKMMKLFTDDILILEAKIRQETNRQKPNKEAIEHLNLERKALLKTKQQYEFEYKYKRYNTLNDLYYSIGLLAAFAVVCCLFLPPTAVVPATALVVGAIGAALCFTANLISAGVVGWLDLAKSKEAKQLALQECNELLADFIAHQDERSDFVNKQLYLDMKRLVVNSEYQQRMVDWQKLSLIRGVLVDALIPPILFVSFVFLPLGMGLSVVAAGFALAVVTHFKLEASKPADANLPEFEEDAYKKFYAAPSIDALKTPKAPTEHGIFAPSTIKEKSNSLRDEEDLSGCCIPSAQT